MSPPATLHAPPEHPESALPPGVTKLSRPPALNKATQLAFLRFEKPCLEKAERFWRDFGLTTVFLDHAMLVMRAAGRSPAVLVAYKGNKPRFLGAAFVVPGSTDFKRLERECGARGLREDQIPGGGRGVTMNDPDGNEVWLITDWPEVEPLPLRDPLNGHMNTLARSPRVNVPVRTPIEPARVGRLGHLVLQTTDFSVAANWYMQHLGLIPTDVQYLPDGSPMLTFFRLDLGDAPADHHTVVIAGGLQARYEHSAWEVCDLDALGQGHQVLRANGHRHMWGIGRHVLGSQLFDYWYDPDGFEFEHYTDGDLFTSSHETRYVPFSTGSIWAWGDDVPASMFPAKSLGTLFRAIRLLVQRRTTLARLRLMGSVIDAPARPWLK